MEKNEKIMMNGKLYSKPLIKRVIATEGQTIEIKRREDGVQEVYVDGNKLEESYINLQSVIQSGAEDSNTLTIPQGELFVMGDNRGHSYDSRSFGTVKVEWIVGRALFRIFPLNEMGLLTNR